jgi:hypothetical protein
MEQQAPPAVAPGGLPKEHGRDGGEPVEEGIAAEQDDEGEEGETGPDKGEETEDDAGRAS